MYWGSFRSTIMPSTIVVFSGGFHCHAIFVAHFLFIQYENYSFIQYKRMRIVVICILFGQAADMICQ